MPSRVSQSEIFLAHFLFARSAWAHCQPNSLTRSFQTARSGFEQLTCYCTVVITSDELEREANEAARVCRQLRLGKPFPASRPKRTQAPGAQAGSCFVTTQKSRKPLTDSRGLCQRVRRQDYESCHASPNGAPSIFMPMQKPMVGGQGPSIIGFCIASQASGVVSARRPVAQQVLG
jgi:hypothetical protein